jgi:hypothetical protein
MKPTRWIIIGLILTAIFGTIFYAHQKPQDLYLVAKNMVTVYMSENEAMAPVPSMTVFKIAPSERVEVIECIDVKHYMIYKIRMPDGRQGFVNDGEYSLERFDKPSSC